MKTIFRLLLSLTAFIPLPSANAAEIQPNEFGSIIYYVPTKTGTECYNAPKAHEVLRKVKNYIESRRINGRYTVTGHYAGQGTCQAVVALQESNYEVRDESVKVYRNGSRLTHLESKQDALERVLKEIRSRKDAAYIVHVEIHELTRTPSSLASFRVETLYISPRN